MARLARICPIDVLQHIIQRDNNHHICFADDADLSAYANWLKLYADKFSVDIHVWVFMTNHVYLLCTPHEEHGTRKMMQALGRQYVRYFNYKYQRTGTLWEGRFKSCLVDKENYLLCLYRYIEFNPVRSKMVNTPAQYTWSSYQINALGKKSELCTPHPLYLALGKTRKEVQEAYRSLFNSPNDKQLLGNIRSSINSGMAIGSENFKLEIERLTGGRLHNIKKGRPLGSCRAED
jgi:putative transposase